MKSKKSKSKLVLFKRPFLCLRIYDNGWSSWYLDVGGNIRKYFSPVLKKPTSLLLGLCKMLASRGCKVYSFGEYRGRGWPLYVVRPRGKNDFSFIQVDKRTREEAHIVMTMGKEVEFVPPVYAEREEAN